MSAPNPKSANMPLPFLISVSFFGLILAALLAVNPPVPQEDFAWRKPVIGLIFASVCVLGSLAVFFPDWCSRAFNPRGKKEQRSWLFSFKRNVSASKGDSAVLRGHHPVCTNFSSHVYDLAGRRFCATCSGLFLGALMALVGVAAYFFENWHIGGNALFIVCLGTLGVAFGLLHPLLIKVERSFIRVISGALLAIGSLLILTVVDELARNFFLDVFVVLLAVFWLITRISFSHWEHEKMCSACSSTSCKL